MAVIGREAARAPLTSADINDGIVSANDLATTLDLSSKTITMPSLSTVDINGGTIDGVTIGGSSAGAITGTTGQFNTSLNVDGTVTADGLTVDGDATLQANTTSEAPVLTLRNDGDKQAAIVLDADRSSANGSLGQIRGAWNGTAVTRVVMAAGSDTANKDDGRIYLQTAPDGTLKDRLLVDNNGDISFYEDTGTTPKFFWDASAERLGIGTSSPQSGLDIQSGGSTTLIVGSGDNAGSGIQTIEFRDRYGASGFTNGQIGSFIRQERDGTTADYDLVFGTNTGTGTDASERMRLDSSGQVGIGTSSPSQKLHVVVDSDSALGSIVKNTNAGTSAASRLILGNNTDNGAGLIRGSSTNTTFGANTLAVYQNLSAPITFWTSNTEKMRLDSSGNVGIGTTSPAATSSTFKNLQLGLGAVVNGRTDDTPLYLSSNVTYNSGWKYIANTTASQISLGTNIQFFNAPSGTAGSGATLTERMRLDSSGNLLVGKTAASSATTGHGLTPSGLAYHTCDGAESLLLNRLTSDGAIAEFRKDNTTVGSIGAFSSQSYYAGTDSGIRFYVGGFIPCSETGAAEDNTQDIGLLTVRYDDIYATNGTIQTSDRNEKQDIEALSEAEQRVAVAAKGLLRKFRWKSAVEEKGDDARIHFGIIAQDLQAAFEAEGLDAGRYAMFIHSTWTDEETGEERSRMGVRYSELLAFIIAAL